MSTHRWTLQETSGSRVGDDPGANDGTIDGSVLFGVTGPGDDLTYAIDFAGGSVSPVVLDETFTLSRKHAWTLHFWAKQDGANQEGMVLGDRDSPVSFVWLTSSLGGLVVRPAHSVPVTGTNGGLDIVFPLSAATRTKWSEYELTYSVDEIAAQLTLAVDGVVVATEPAPSGLELRINTLGGGHTSNTFAFDGQLAGIEISGTEIDYAKPDKVVLVLGQSNAEGRFVNHQEYSHLTQFASKYEDGQWSEIFDDGTHGEVWPLVATRWLADQEESVGFIYAAEGGTGLVDGPDWAAGGTTYDAAIATVNAADVDRIDVLLWFQGERDANLAVTREAYAAAMEDLIARLHIDLPGKPPLICGQINSVLAGSTDDIRNAQVDAWSHEHIYPGPVTYDIGPLADDLHFTTDAEAVTLADRWWSAIDEALFDGTDGTPPRLKSAVIDGVEVTLTFDRELEVATSYDHAAWTFSDDSASINVISAAQTDIQAVTLTLDQIPSTSQKSIALGTGRSAQGLNVPRGVATQPALPETFNVTVPSQHDLGSASIRDTVSVQKLKRAVFVN